MRLSNKFFLIIVAKLNFNVKNKVIDIFKFRKNFHEVWVLLILFLFPMAGPVVRHWNNLFFLLLTITSIVFIMRKKRTKKLENEELILVWVFILFFLIFLFSALFNGWGNNQTLELGNELKFLFFVPIYLLVREYKLAKKAILAGVLFSIPVIFLFSVYEFFIILPNVSRTELHGAYFHLFLGPITVLMLLLCYSAYKEWTSDSKYIWVFPIYIFMSSFVIIYSHARLAQLTIIGGMVVLLFLIIKTVKLRILGIGLIGLLIVSAFQIDSFQLRFNRGVDEVNYYLDHYNDVNDEIHSTSFGLRLEMWRSTQYIFKDYPIIGIGGGNYSKVIKKYTNEGLVSHSVEHANQVHNSYIEVLISKGILGLILLLLIFYYPVYLSWKFRFNNNKSHFNFIMIFIFSTAISLMSIGESMLINKDNGVSYIIFFTAVFFSSMIIEKEKNL